MSKEIKGDHKHLTLSDRIYIEQALDRGDKFRTIAKFMVLHGFLGDGE